jgi:5-methylcytosine-specific restriction endonuclease McrA
MSANPRYANGNARRKLRERWKAIGAPCGICGRPIDYDLGMVTDPLTGKRRPHPMSFVVDEIVPIKYGGQSTFENTRPAHYQCNARRGAGDRAKPALRDALPQPESEW